MWWFDGACSRHNVLQSCNEFARPFVSVQCGEIVAYTAERMRLGSRERLLRIDPIGSSLAMKYVPSHVEVIHETTD